MKYRTHRPSALARSVAFLQAGLLIITLVLGTGPSSIAFAQATEPAEVTLPEQAAISLETETTTEVETETTELETETETTVETEDTTLPEEEGGIVEAAFSALRLLEVEKSVTVTKEFAGTTTAACEGISFSVTNMNGDSVGTFEFDADCSVTVPIEDNGSYLIAEAAEDSVGFDVTYEDDSGETNDENGCHLSVSNGNPERNCAIVNTVADDDTDPEVPDACVIVSDTTTEEGEDDMSEILSFVHTAWAEIVDAFWIWGDNPVADTTVDETQVFTKSFTLDVVPTNADLEIAADNGYVLTVNGIEVATADTGSNNYNPTQNYDITDELNAGMNTIEISVTNLGTPDITDPESNPAGVIYKLTIEGSECDEVPTPPEEQDEVVVHIYKHLMSGTTTAQVPDDSTAPDFPMTATWDATNIGAGSGSYVLGGATPNLGGAPFVYSAQTSAMTAPADYTTSEVTGTTTDFLPAGAVCEADKYRLVGYKSGTSLAGAEAAAVASTSPEYTDLTSDRYLIVVNEDCDDVLAEEPEEPGQCVLVSDTTTIEGGTAASLVSVLHSAWTAVIAGASWIWGEDPIADPVNETTQIFTKTFTLDSAAATSTLYIAADNSYTVSVNGDEVASSTDEDNYSAAGQDTIAIDPSAFVVGANTLTISVTNFAMEDGTTETNPAGLDYRLVIDGADCEETTPPPQDSVQVHIYKHLMSGTTTAQVPDDSTAPDFPMSATWDATNIGAGSGSYVLGNAHGGASFQFAADTAPMSLGADYTTSEVTGTTTDFLPADAVCEADKYRLVGYKWGTSLASATATTSVSTTSPSFTDLMSDRYVIVVNEDCDELGTGGPEDTATLTLVKHAATSTESFNFTLTPGATSTATSSLGVGTVDGAGTTTIELAPGVYDLTENMVSGWALESVTCTEGEAIVNGQRITIDDTDNDVTCTFVNTELPPGQCVVVSDTLTTEDGDPASLVSVINAAWTAFIAGASWIWGEDPVATPTVDTTQTFTRTFELDDTNATTTLYVAADNTYAVSLNGVEIASSTDGNNFALETQDTIAIASTSLIAGTNTLEFTVTNLGTTTDTAEGNPAGLMFRLVVDGVDCGTIEAIQNNSSGGGGGGGGSSRRGSSSNNNDDDGEVLGASTDGFGTGGGDLGFDIFGVGGADNQVDFLPFGAPNTGAGGMSSFIMALGLGSLLVFMGLRGRIL